MLTCYKWFTDLRIEVEIEPKAVTNFVKKYLDLTGDDPRRHDGYKPQANRWGFQCRIYFNGEDAAESLRVLGFNVEDDPKRGYLVDRFRYRVTGQTLFWRLMRAGYHLGDCMATVEKLKKAA